MVFTQNGRGFAGATSARYKVINNTVTLPSGTNQNIGCGAGVPCGENGISVYADEAATTCAAVSGNTVYDVASFTGGFDVYLAERVGPPAGAQVTIESGAIGVPPAAVTYINANNTLAGANKTADEGANVSTVVSCGTFP